MCGAENARASSTQTRARPMQASQTHFKRTLYAFLRLFLLLCITKRYLSLSLIEPSSILPLVLWFPHCFLLLHLFIDELLLWSISSDRNNNNNKPNKNRKTNNALKMRKTKWNEKKRRKMNWKLKRICCSIGKRLKWKFRTVYLIPSMQSIKFQMGEMFEYKKKNL